MQISVTIHCGFNVHACSVADITSSTLLQWEMQIFNHLFGPAASINSYTSGIVQLVQTTCKTMGGHQRDVYRPFNTFLKANNISRNSLASFRFYCLMLVFSTSFLLYVVNAQQALRSFFDLPEVQVPEYIAGCKSLAGK